ncbi:patatin-like phospholipase family protein [Palleronia rufa]|uniref:patatin-like phospholipase family protein n=1 Tax=Palleronia rufa TaxID=1530186 RepID=UPI000690E90E|nr:patatin-like phospholipase family protein [Palleronia rufa]
MKDSVQRPHGRHRVLVLQGGDALGSYQAGVFETLHSEGYAPDWVAGTSIGAINAAIIAGNAPEDRVPHLQAFWTAISANVRALPSGGDHPQIRAAYNSASAATALVFGAPGMFRPRIVPSWAFPGPPDRLSYYDTEPLRASLLELVDFDRINAGETRLNLGAVNVATGNFRYFDSETDTIGPEHVMASGALPPGFPAVEIDGEFYWDGGLVSNTPLEHVLAEDQTNDLMIFQVDLFSAIGAMPRSMRAVEERKKDIRYSSRTRLNTDRGLEKHRAKALVRRPLDKLPPELVDDPDVEALREKSTQHSVTIVQLIHRGVIREGQFKDYEFSRLTMTEHWAAGEADAQRTLAQKERFLNAAAPGEMRTFDVSRPAPLQRTTDPEALDVREDAE